MKKVIEFNHTYNVGDIVYGIFENKAVKAKITSINYNSQSNMVTDNHIGISYEAANTNDKIYGTYYIREDANNTLNGVWFKSKDDAIDYLKTQIDKITTDEYN